MCVVVCGRGLVLWISGVSDIGSGGYGGVGVGVLVMGSFRAGLVVGII